MKHKQFKRFASGLMAVAMALTMGGFDHLQYSKQAKAAEASITLSNPTLYKHITDDLTLPQSNTTITDVKHYRPIASSDYYEQNTLSGDLSVISNGQTTAPVIYMDVNTAISFTLTNSSGGAWKAKLTDENQAGSAFTRDNNNNYVGVNDGALSASMTEVVYGSTSTSLSNANPNLAISISGSTLTLYAGNQASSDRYLNIYTQGNSDTSKMITAHIIVCNPVTKFVGEKISWDHKMVANHTQTFALGNGAIKNGTSNGDSHAQDTTDIYDWTVTNDTASGTWGYTNKDNTLSATVTAGESAGILSVSVAAKPNITSDKAFVALQKRPTLDSRTITVMKENHIKSMKFVGGEEVDGVMTYNIPQSGNIDLSTWVEYVKEDSGSSETDLKSWKSSKKEVAEVDKDGKVKAGTKVGSTDITLTNTDSQESITCRVNVYTQTDSLDLYVNGSETASSYVNARVGHVISLKASEKNGATEYLTAKADSDLVEIVAAKQDTVNSDKYFTINVTKDATKITEKKEVTVTVSTVRSSSTKGENVDQMTKNLLINIYPVLNDTAKLSLTLDDQTVKNDTIDIYTDVSETLKDSNDTFVLAAKVQNEEVGDQFTFSPVQSDSGSYYKTDVDRDLSKTSVNINGIEKTGATTQTLRVASVSNPKIYKDIKVNVLKSVTKLETINASLSMAAGDTYVLSVKKTPENADEGINWTVEKPTVATIDENGVVTAVSAGETKIIGYAKYHNGVNNIKEEIIENGVVVDPPATTIVKVETVIKVYSESSMTLSETELTKTFGDANQKISAKVVKTNNEAATAPVVKWTTDNAKVVSFLNGETTTDSMVTEETTTLVYGEAGTATVTATCGKLSATCKVVVAPKKISDTIITLDKTTFDYTSNEIKPVISVVFQNKELKEGTDYSVEFQDNINAGTAKAVFTGLGNFSETHTVNYTINKVSLTGGSVNMEAIPSQWYCATYMTPDLKLTLGDYQLIPEVDYTATYSNNVNEGTAEVVVEGKGNFTGKLDKTNASTCTFTIVEKKIANKATKVKIEPLFGSPISQNSDIIYVDVKSISAYQLTLEADSGVTDDIVYVSSENTNEKCFSAGTVGVTDGATATLAIEGKEPGTSKIIVNSMGGMIYKPITVVVYSPATKVTIKGTDKDGNEVSMSDSQTSIIANHTVDLKAVFEPSNSTDQVEWSVSDTEIAEVSETGVLTAKKAGSFRLYAVTKKTETGERGVKATANITVIENKPATSVELSDKTLTIKSGESKTLTAKTAPENNTEQLVWSTSDERIATVTKEGVVTGVANGTVTITCSTFSGLIKDTCEVAVYTPSTGITLNQGENTLKIGESFMLTANLAPQGAVENVIWSTDDATNSIVSITAPDASDVVGIHEATITAKKSGTVVITVKSAGTGFEAKCTVTVLANPKTPSTNPSQMVKKPGKSKITSLKNSKKGKVTIKFKKVSGAKGYKILYSTKSSMKGAKSKTTTKTSFTIKSLKKKKTYYFQVQAYKVVNGKKLYGSKCTKKKIKIKK